jgi:glucose/mannose transport system substrate-binding protein
MSITTAIILGAFAAPALAEPSVEVMHFWTTGGEAAALAAVRDKVVAGGVGWTDAPVAGGGGDAAKDAITDFFNSDVTAKEGAAALADAILAAK